MVRPTMMPSDIYLEIEFGTSTIQFVACGSSRRRYPNLMESLQFGLKHRNILYYPADDSDSLDGISPARTIPQRRLLTLNSGTVASHVWFYRLLLG